MSLRGTSDYWEEGDIVTPLSDLDFNGRCFTKGKEYVIKWISYDDEVFVTDDKGKENGWHVSQWEFVREGGTNE